MNEDDMTRGLKAFCNAASVAQNNIILWVLNDSEMKTVLRPIIVFHYVMSTAHPKKANVFIR